MWGSDYPHFDSTFPKSREAIARNFEGVPSDEQRTDSRREHGLRVYKLQDVIEPAPVVASVRAQPGSAKGLARPASV